MSAETVFYWAVVVTLFVSALVEQRRAAHWKRMAEDTKRYADELAKLARLHGLVQAMHCSTPKYMLDMIDTIKPAHVRLVDAVDEIHRVAHQYDRGRN